MKTRSARLAKKRKAPNRRDDSEVERYANGRIDYGRTGKRDDVMAVAKAQRMKHPGVLAGNANSATAGTALGRMLLQAEITEAQFEAGREFDRRRAAYLSAIQAPKTPRSGSDIGYIHETNEPPPTIESVFRIRETEEQYAKRCTDVKLRYSVVRRAAMEADPLGLMAMETIVCSDQMVGVLLGPMRLACNAIARVLQQAR